MFFTIQSGTFISIHSVDTRYLTSLQKNPFLINGYIS